MKMPKLSSGICIFLALAVFSAATAPAATYSIAASGTWSINSTWLVSGTTPPAVPGSSDSIVTNGAGGPTLSVDGASRTVTDFSHFAGGSALTVLGASGAGGTALTITGTLNKSSLNTLTFRGASGNTNPLSLTINELIITGVGNTIFGSGTQNGLSAFTATTARISGASNIRPLFGKIATGTANIHNLFVDGGQLAIYGGSTISGTQTLAVNALSNSGTGGVIATSNDSATNNTAHGILLINSSGSSAYSGVVTDMAGTPGAGTAAVLSLVKNGAGTQVLAGSNTYTAGTTINNGVLQLGNSGTLGGIVGNVSTGSSSAVLAFNRSNAYTFGGTISGSGQVRQMGSGTTTLTANNTYTGTTSVSAGTLLLSAASNNIASSSVIDVATGATLNVGGVTGGFTLAGTQTLKGTGTVLGNVTTGSGSTLSPGNSPGTLVVTGSLTLGNFTNMTFEVGDLVAVSGDLTLGTSFNLSSANLAIGNYDLFSYSGDLFGAVNLLTWNAPSITSEYYFLSDGDSVYLSVVPEPGSYALLGLGLGVIAWRTRLRRRSQSS